VNADLSPEFLKIRCWNWHVLLILEKMGIARFAKRAPIVGK
jgi:hypothetical protein